MSTHAPSPTTTAASALTPVERLEAGGWITDCWDDSPADMTDQEIVNVIDLHYYGGITQFLIDSEGAPADVALERARQLRGARADQAVLLAMHVASTNTTYFDVRPILPPSWKSHLMHFAPYGADFAQGVEFHHERITATC